MTAPITQILKTEGGTIAYDVLGDGPLVVCLPGMGDLRSSYRHLAPRLVEAGFRVATVDLRGHGDSSTNFSEYGDEATARDTIALLELLGSAVIVGNSMSAAAGVIAAAERPELVNGLVLVGPFVRDPKANPIMKAVMRVATATPFVAATWKTFLPTLFPGRKPNDHADYLSRVIAAIRRPGYSKSFSRTTRASHAPAEARLGQVHTPTLVVMGELDPDFSKPSDEAAWITEQLRGELLMVQDAGHYPHSQRPDLVAPAITSFLQNVTNNA